MDIFTEAPYIGSWSLNYVMCWCPSKALRHGPKPGCQEAEAEAFSILEAEAEALTPFKLEAEAEALVTKPKPKPGYLYWAKCESGHLESESGYCESESRWIRFHLHFLESESESESSPKRLEFGFESGFKSEFQFGFAHHWCRLTGEEYSNIPLPQFIMTGDNNLFTKKKKKERKKERKKNTCMQHLH